MDNETNKLLKGVCGLLDFGIRTETVLPPQPIQPVDEQKNFWMQEAASYVGAALCYYIAYRASNSHWIGGIVGVGVGCLCSQFWKRAKKALPAPSVAPKVRIVSTAEEIAEQINEAIGLMKQVKKLIQTEHPAPKPNNKDYPLESDYQYVLAFLNKLYRKCLAREKPDLMVMEGIEDVLDEAGYMFAEYDGNNMDCFTSSLSRMDVPYVTTLPALLNAKTKRCIFKGHVLFQQD